MPSPDDRVQGAGTGKTADDPDCDHHNCSEKTISRGRQIDLYSTRYRLR